MLNPFFIVINIIFNILNNKYAPVNKYANIENLAIAIITENSIPNTNKNGTKWYIEKHFGQ